MKTTILYCSILFVLTSLGTTENTVRIIFEEEKGLRSSFCMYSDGRFYETKSSGCVGQEFASGSWTTANDTITLSYQSNNIFTFEVLESVDTTSAYQIIKIVDFYNQPVRFQNVCFDTTCQNLYNPGILKIQKGKYIFYSMPIFEDQKMNNEDVYSGADTITYKWHCNRESIESINGGSLFVANEAISRRIVLKHRKVIPLN